MRIFITSTALIFGLLGAGVSPAFAAKGVKKKGANGQHQHHGIVTHVQHHRAMNASGHIGEITIRTQHTKKKGQPAAANAKGNAKNKAGKNVAGQNGAGQNGVGHHEKFFVSHRTRFAYAQGQKFTPTGFASVHVGEHVTITSRDRHAETVTIHSRHQVKQKQKGKGNKGVAAGKKKKIK